MKQNLICISFSNFKKKCLASIPSFPEKRGIFSLTLSVGRFFVDPKVASPSSSKSLDTSESFSRSRAGMSTAFSYVGSSISVLLQTGQILLLSATYFLVRADAHSQNVSDIFFIHFSPIIRIYVLTYSDFAFSRLYTITTQCFLTLSDTHLNNIYSKYDSWEHNIRLDNVCFIGVLFAPLPYSCLFQTLRVFLTCQEMR